MSLYNDASLILYPSGYKEDKLYSIKPTNGDGDFDFTRASTATRVNSEGLIETVATGVPRIDYTGGGCGKLLLEPQRSNLVTYSEQFDNAYWTKSNSSVVSGFASPDGTANAFKLVENTSTSAHNVFRNSSTVTLEEYSFSCFVKTNGRNVKLDFFGGTNNAIFNLTTGVVISTNGTGLTAKIETLSNGWYRCSINQLQTSTTIYPNILCVDGSNNSTYTGDGTSGVYIYGAQLEASSYPTSYIPTLASSVTRLADAASKTGISSLINSTEGVLYIETKGFIDVPSSSGYIQLSKNGESSADNSLVIQHRNNGFLRIYVNGFGTPDIQFNQNIDFTENHKIAVLYKLNGYKLFIDGVEKPLYLTPTQSVFSGLDNLSFDLRGSLGWSGNIKEAKLYNNGLTDQELIALTS